MTDRPDDDLSPSLGGARATEAPAPEPEPAQETPFADGDGEIPELSALLAELGQSELGEIITRLEPLSREIQDVVQDTIRIMEERLPPTLAAFEGLFSALGSVFEPLFEEPRDPEA